MWTDRRKLAVGLVFSLLLNALLAGVLAGVEIGGTGREFVGRPQGVVPQANFRALSRADKQEFRLAMAAHRDAIRDARRDHRAARQAAEADIAAPAFNRAKVEADFAAVRAAGARIQENIHAGLIDGLAALPPDTRAMVVRRDQAASGQER